MTKFAAARLLGSPVILDGEAASGWLYRVGVHHRIKPGALMRRWGFNNPTSLLDFHPLDQNVIDMMASTTVQSRELIDEALCLDHTILGKSTFCCLTNDLVAHRPIYRYCPACLGGDVVPHFRLPWRFAYSFVCEIHHCPLLDACAHCSQKIDLTLLFPRRTFASSAPDLRHCNRCAAPLRAFPIDPLSAEIADQMITFQRWFHDGVRRGGIPKHGIVEPPPMYIERYLRRVRFEDSRKPLLVGLDMEKLFGNEWRDLARLIPCMQSSGAVEPSVA
ncbi:TniQ family protein [Paraburkholderia acidicola]|uniref:TniQ family protein n=1 Tax=Paraburkholderia acidicola TaxID=1912599 RepID=A0ABV1LLH3_9BURK